MDLQFVKSRLRRIEEVNRPPQQTMANTSNAATPWSVQSNGTIQQGHNDSALLDVMPPPSKAITGHSTNDQELFLRSSSMQPVKVTETGIRKESIASGNALKKRKSDGLTYIHDSEGHWTDMPSTMEPSNKRARHSISDPYLSVTEHQTVSLRKPTTATMYHHPLSSPERAQSSIDKAIKYAASGNPEDSDYEPEFDAVNSSAQSVRNTTQTQECIAKLM
jgi:hypothetical protein